MYQENRMAKTLLGMWLGVLLVTISQLVLRLFYSFSA